MQTEKTKAMSKKDFVVYQKHGTAASLLGKI